MGSSAQTLENCTNNFGMDGRARWRDNVFFERIWRSIKYEESYLHSCALVSEARTSIGRYIDFYNIARPHSSLRAQMPDQVYFNYLPESIAV
jgi:putative transposase